MQRHCYKIRHKLQAEDKITVCLVISRDGELLKACLTLDLKLLGDLG